MLLFSFAWYALNVKIVTTINPVFPILYLLYCTVLYCTVLYCTVLYCTVVYCTIRSMTKASRPSYANVVRKGGDTEVRGKQMTNEGALPSEQKNEFNSDDTSWIKIQTRNKIGRNDRKDGQKRQTQKRMIHGSVRSDIVHGAPLPKRDFFISRVVKSTTDEQMLNYVRNKGIRSVEIKRMSNDDVHGDGLLVRFLHSLH